MTNKNNVSVGSKNRENEVEPIEQMKQKNSVNFDSRNRENEHDQIEEMKQKNSDKVDLEIKESRLALIDSMKQKNNNRFGSKRTESKRDTVEPTKPQNNNKFGSKRTESRYAIIGSMELKNNNKFDSINKRNEVKKIEPKRDSKNRNAQVLTLNRKTFKRELPFVHLGPKRFLKISRKLVCKSFYNKCLCRSWLKSLVPFVIFVFQRKNRKKYRSHKFQILIY